MNCFSHSFAQPTGALLSCCFERPLAQMIHRARALVMEAEKVRLPIGHPRMGLWAAQNIQLLTRCQLASRLLPPHAGGTKCVGCKVA